MKIYLEEFKKMVDELNQHPEIIVTDFVINPPATEEEIKFAEKKFKLTNDMLEFYKSANGITLSWELEDTEDTEDTVRGKIELLPVEKVFGDWKNTIYFDFDGGDEFKSLHPLDFFVNEACAALNLEDSDNPEVYYHYCGEEMNTLKMDFKEYLNALLKTRGFWYWQTVVVAELTGEENTTEPENFRVNMPKLFPDFKLSEILK